MSPASGVHFILFVADRARSRVFYGEVLDAAPRLDVPGMTEFELPGGAVLGLMPSAGISRLLGPALPDPAGAQGTPRSELYLRVPDPEERLAAAVRAGAAELSRVAVRDWGHRAGYCLDPDGHALAFACEEPGA
ncbi:MAG: VOC family protein [Deltaproteobacteria bacterium]|nr:VOC family protein [Deltaproteobacteria bacterium]